MSSQGFFNINESFYKRLVTTATNYHNYNTVSHSSNLRPTQDQILRDTTENISLRVEEVERWIISSSSNIE